MLNRRGLGWALAGAIVADGAGSWLHRHKKPGVKKLGPGARFYRRHGCGTGCKGVRAAFPTIPHVSLDTPLSGAQSPLLDDLNPEQLAAVTLPAGHALILAGAGSGKTRVLTTRIAWLLATAQVSPGGVMAVTFTNKAAKEMMTRLSAMLPVNVRGMWIGTFHGLCNRFLRAHYKLANLPQAFQILDTQDQLSAIKRLMKQHNVDEERFPARQTQWFIAGCKEDGLRPRDVEARDQDTRKKVELYQLYEEQCQREGVVDFGELMLRSYELLRDNDPVREHYQRRFRHILVDEFQDTNRLQYAWLKHVCRQPRYHRQQRDRRGRR